jgi:hypothetical protein
MAPSGPLALREIWYRRSNGQLVNDAVLWSSTGAPELQTG